MYLEISNPMEYHVALYIRLSKEDENEGPSQSVTNQKSLLDEFVAKHHLSVYDAYIDDMAKLVIAGKYGNGQERKEKLAAEGHPWTEIQARVNQLLS